jgi:hypothetical protein
VCLCVVVRVCVRERVFVECVCVCERTGVFLRAPLSRDTPLSLQDGFTALLWAAQEGHGGVVEALMKAACNADIQDKV